MAEPFLLLEGVAKTYGATQAVAGIDLAVERGEFVVLLGPSGSGKTTILSILGGFIEPTSGRMLLDGEDVTGLSPARRPTATVFQDYALFPHMSVAANVAFGLAMHKVPNPERRRRVEEMLERVGLAGFGRRRIHELSGGQRQRVALARAIAVEPKLLLLDEPLGALDLALRRQMQEELVRLQKQLGTTFVHVTHDQDEAMSIADRIVVMNHGRIEDQGRPDRVYLKPASLFAATFMGESNIITGTVRARDGRNLLIETALGTLAVPADAELGRSISLSLRPEHLGLGPAPTGALALPSAIIEEVVFQGTHLRVRGRTESGIELLLRLPAGSSVGQGTRAPLHADPSRIVLLAS
ncbi:MAG TPA: ABC transporter ATP-binding protein [Alphaproteobacteria bacterium]|nr:ABC transporter ATP-binding protein [Alphaproteobacteria bacterium]